MSLGFNVECPKCHADRTLLESTFCLPGQIDPRKTSDTAAGTMLGALPVRAVLCVRCHYLELYHDVGLAKLS